jgi:hypothetical protein
MGHTPLDGFIDQRPSSQIFLVTLVFYLFRGYEINFINWDLITYYFRMLNVLCLNIIGYVLET